MTTHTSPRRRRAACATFILLTLTLAAPHARAQKALNGTERDRALNMLKVVREDIKKNYYDVTYRGVDVDARFREAEEQLKAATSVGHAFRIIAQAVVDMGDSHTYFMPPSRAARYDYGWDMMMVGDACYVHAVRPKSDADVKGLRPGDRLLKVSGLDVTRDDLWKIKYLFYTLDPQPGLRLVVQSPGQQPRQVDVMTKVEARKRTTDLTDETSWFELEREAENFRKTTRQRFHEEGDLFIWRMPHFEIDEGKIDQIMSRARKYKSMILDLRGNYGGPTVALQRLVGNFFDREIKIADLKGRKELKPLMSKPRGADAYKGELVVLVDSMSASAAEVFARVVQLEKRGTVVGDRTAGAVMISRFYDHKAGTDVLYFFGTSVTYADLIMADGRSLELVGVTPDESALTTGEEMAAGRDPVLARAAAKLGVEMKPDKAGSLFPYEWPN